MSLLALLLTSLSVIGFAAPASAVDDGTFSVTAPAEGLRTTNKRPVVTGGGVEYDNNQVLVDSGGLRYCNVWSVNPSTNSWTCNGLRDLAYGRHRLDIGDYYDGNPSFALVGMIYRNITVIPLAPTLDTPAAGDVSTTPRTTFSGIGEPGLWVKVFNNVGSTSGTAYQEDIEDPICVAQAAAVTGEWTCDAALDEGNYDVLAFQGPLQNGGVLSDASGPATFDVDLINPTFTTPADGSVVKTQYPTFAGTVDSQYAGDTSPAGYLISVVDNNDGLLCSATVQADGRWECTSEVMMRTNRFNGERTHLVRAWLARDNNSGAAFTENIYNLMTTMPWISIPTDGSVLNYQTPTYHGTGNPGYLITVVDDDSGDSICSATVRADGTWSCQGDTPLVDGVTYNVAVLQGADEVNWNYFRGNTVTFNIALDGPVISSPADGSTVPTHLPTFSGIASPNHEITVYDDTDNELCTTTANGVGAWSCKTTVALPTGLNSGIYAMYLENPDADPKYSDSIGFTIAMAAPVINAPSNGSTITSTAPIISGTGTPDQVVTVVEGPHPLPSHRVRGYYWEGGHTVWAFQSATDPADGNALLSDAAPDEIGRNFSIELPTPTWTGPEYDSTVTTPLPLLKGTGEPGMLLQVYDYDDDVIVCTTTVDANGNWQCTPGAPLTNESLHELLAQQTDDATSAAQVLWSGSPESAYNYIYVSVPAPMIDAPADGATIGTHFPTFSGTGAPEAALTVYDADDNELCTTTVKADGSWSCKSTVALPTGLNNGIYAIGVVDGLEPMHSNAINLKIVLAAPVITGPADGSTVAPNAKVTGTGNPGATVTVSEGTTSVCTAVVAANGTWSCTPAAPFTVGSHDLKATQTEAGETSPAAETTFQVVAAPLASPTTVDPLPRVVRAKRPVLTGTGTPGTTIVVKERGRTVCATTVDASGHWSCAAQRNLRRGWHKLTVSANGARVKVIRFRIGGAALSLPHTGARVVPGR